jgi:glycosyltransferase involved in cell wall biosynthesis
MRVAHFVQRYPPAIGGSEAYFHRLGRFLATQGDRVSVFTSNALDLAAFWSPAGRTIPAETKMEDGVEVRRFGLVRWPGRRYFLKPVSLWPQRLWQCLTQPCNPASIAMWRAVQREPGPLEVVHATAFPYAWPLACGLRLARRLGAAFLLTPFLHLGDPDDPNDRTRRAYTAPWLMHLARAADLVFVQTQGERRVLLDQGVAPERLVLLGMGVDADECTGGQRESARVSWGAARDEVVVGHLANASREKGTLDLLRAAETCWRQGQRMRLVLAGPEMPSFARFWETHQPRGPVIRLGVLSEEGKRDFYAGVDVFALPSRSDSFGLVLLEAWANGVPNVGYRAGGIAEVIRDGEDGLLVPCGDVSALSDALGLLVANAGIRVALGRSGRARVRNEFGWGPKLAIVRASYENAAADRRHRACPPGNDGQRRARTGYLTDSALRTR